MRRRATLHPYRRAYHRRAILELGAGSIDGPRRLTGPWPPSSSRIRADAGLASGFAGHTERGPSWHTRCGRACSWFCGSIAVPREMRSTPVSIDGPPRQAVVCVARPHGFRGLPRACSASMRHELDSRGQHHRNRLAAHGNISSSQLPSMPWRDGRLAMRDEQFVAISRNILQRASRPAARDERRP